MDCVYVHVDDTEWDICGYNKYACHQKTSKTNWSAVRIWITQVFCTLSYFDLFPFVCGRFGPLVGSFHFFHSALMASDLLDWITIIMFLPVLPSSCFYRYSCLCASTKSTMLCGAQLWPLSVAQKKKPEAAHHKFQRQIMGIWWKDKVSNERVRAQTLEKIGLIIKERRLRWLGHVLRMDDNRLPRQAVHWNISGTWRKPGRPQKNWIDTISQDLKSIGMTWEVAQQLAVNREGWHWRVAQCLLRAMN